MTKNGLAKEFKAFVAYIDKNVENQEIRRELASKSYRFRNEYGKDKQNLIRKIEGHKHALTFDHLFISIVLAKFGLKKYYEIVRKAKKVMYGKSKVFVNGEYYPPLKTKEKVFKRDRYKCRTCNRKYLLTIHHIDENRKNNKLDNLIVLCEKCHANRHGRKNTNKRLFALQDKIEVK